MPTSPDNSTIYSPGLSALRASSIQYTAWATLIALQLMLPTAVLAASRVGLGLWAMDSKTQNQIIIDGNLADWDPGI